MNWHESSVNAEYFILEDFIKLIKDNSLYNQYGKNLNAEKRVCIIVAGLVGSPYGSTYPKEIFSWMIMKSVQLLGLITSLIMELLQCLFLLEE